MTKLAFSGKAANILFPMGLMLDKDGQILLSGPTLSHIFQCKLSGANFFDVFKVEKPRRVMTLDDLRERFGEKLVLKAEPDDGAPVQLRSVAIGLDEDDGALFLDMSLGTSLADAVRRFSLTSRDFRPNDSSIDLFYTFETQRALLEDSQKMTEALTSAMEDAERKAFLDSVTGIANHRALHRKLKTLRETPGKSERFALMQIDLNRFKLINDTYGHAAGDKILQHAAQVLVSRAGSAGFPARIGGDEFALVVVDRGNTDDLHALAEDIVSDISAPVDIDGNACSVGASIGIVRFRCRDMSSDRLLHQSDVALYDAKSTVAGIKLLTPDLIRKHEERTELVAEIEEGIEKQQFVPYFQPQVDAETKEVCGVEALARWHTDSDGTRAPSQFMKAATWANLMGKIDQQVRRRAIREFADIVKEGTRVGTLSLNLTASNLRSADFIEGLQDDILFAGLQPGNIRLELLESILIDTSEKALLTQCLALKDAGFTLALDDFGTGHASIATLIEAPISLVKIDRSFVMGVHDSAKMQRITAAILAMADRMGLDVLAEGVESQQELNFLMAHGCRKFQGYHFLPPRPIDEVQTWIECRQMQPLDETA